MSLQFAGTRALRWALLVGEVPAGRRRHPRALETMEIIICLKNKQMRASEKNPDAVSDDIRNCKASESGLVLRPALDALFRHLYESDVRIIIIPNCSNSFLSA